VTTEEFEPKNPMIGIIVIIVGSIIFFFSNPPWDTPSSLTAIHSVLGLLAVVTTSVTLVRVRMDPAPAHRMLLVAMGYMSILHFGSALVNFYFPERAVAHTTPHGVFVDIVEMAITGTLLLIVAYLTQVQLKRDSVWYNKIIPALILVGAFSLYALCFYLSETTGLESIFIIPGYLVGGFALIAFSLAIIYFQKQQVGRFAHNSLRLMISCGILAAATVVLLIILPAPSSFWLFNISLQAGSFIFIILATAYPYLVDVGIKPRIAYFYVISLLAFALFPFVIAQIFEETIPLILLIDFGATLLIHLGASILFGVMGYLLYIESRKSLSWHYDPIIIALFSWAIVEISVVFSYFLPFHDNVESFIPYVTGSIIATLLQAVAIHRILKPSEKENVLFSFKTIIFGLSLTSIAILASELIRLQLISTLPGISDTSWAEIIILTISYLMTFNMVNFLMLMTAEKGGEVSIELITTGSQALWIISILLKSNFSDWTAGWWAAEIVMLVGVIGLPFVMTYLHSKEAAEVRTLLDRATLYTEFISKDIESYHQIASDSIGKLSMDVELSDAKLDIVSTVLASISQANELTRNVGSLLKEEKFAPENLEAVDLVECVSFAFHRVITTIYEKYVEFRFEYENGKYFVQPLQCYTEAYIELHFIYYFDSYNT
jgi:hypothetical protein